MELSPAWIGESGAGWIVAPAIRRAVTRLPCWVQRNRPQDCLIARNGGNPGASVLSSSQTRTLLRMRFPSFRTVPEKSTRIRNGLSSTAVVHILVSEIPGFTGQAVTPQVTEPELAVIRDPLELPRLPDTVAVFDGPRLLVSK